MPRCDLARGLPGALAVALSVALAPGQVQVATATRTWISGSLRLGMCT